MNTITLRQTDAFAEWVESLRDSQAKARIAARLARAELGNFGDAKYFDGIGEMRIDYGPGYRIYFARRGAALVVVLGGGDKSSQSEDIKAALKELAAYDQSTEPPAPNKNTRKRKI